MSEPPDPAAAALLNELPTSVKGEVLDVYCSMTALMAARDDKDKMLTSLMALQTQFCTEHAVVGLAIVAGEFIKLLAEGTGQSVDDVVRNTLKARHADPTDTEIFDIILSVADGDAIPDGLGS